MRTLTSALAPLALLVVLVACAGLMSYGVMQWTGDALPLAKIASKATLVLLLLSIFPLRKHLQLSWADLGFSGSRTFCKQIGLGVLLGIVTLLPVLLTLLALDVQIWDESRSWTAGKTAQKIAMALFFSLLIGVGEETLFRGLLLTQLRRNLGLFTAIAISSLYFAALHFLKSKTTIPYAELSVTSGFKLMAEAFANWLNPEIIGALIALFVVGAFLATIRSQIPQSLGLCIGCHAGWVWQIKVCKDFFNLNEHSDYLYLVSNYDGVVGPLVSVWLALALLAYGLLSRSKNQ